MIQIFSNWITYDIFRLVPETRMAEALNFFVFDSIKIFLLLFLITHFMSGLRHYLPIEKLRDFLVKHNLFGLDYFLATFFGAITPFCSCSSIPIFIGFLEAGIPLGVTFAFLITSPLINEIAIAMFFVLFGWKVTLIYVSSGIFLGMAGGWILGRLKMEKYVEEYVWNIKSKKNNYDKKREFLNLRIIKIISKEAFGIIKKISLYIIVGVAVGAFFHGYIPEDFFENYITKDNPWAVPVAVFLAVPLYSNASGVIPIVESLIDKGIPLGTALAFMMAIVGLSLPEAMILKRVMKLRLLLSFFGIVTLGIILIGYGFNIIF